MRITITIDEALVNKAIELADPNMDKSQIFCEAMKTFVRVQTGKRIRALGGAAPNMLDISRRGRDPQST